MLTKLEKVIEDYDSANDLLLKCERGLADVLCDERKKVLTALEDGVNEDDCEDLDAVRGVRKLKKSIR